MVSLERHVSPAFDLYATGSYALEKAKSTREGSFLELLTAVLMAALAFEAFLNEAGQRVWGAQSAVWAAVERRDPISKFRAVAEHVGFEAEAGERPLQTVGIVCRLRSDIVHAKPEFFRAEISAAVAESAEMLAGVEGVSSKWEMACTVAFAERALEDVVQLTDQLSNCIDMTNPLHVGGLTMRSG